MDKDLLNAKNVLNEECLTCVLCRGDIVYKAGQRGVKPLLDWVDSGIDTDGFSAADRVVGNAAAFLYVYLGIKAVYSPIMSKAAVFTLEKHGIEVFYDEKAEYIINRSGTGKCPMEEAVFGISDTKQALNAIRTRLDELKTSDI